MKVPFFLMWLFFAIMDFSLVLAVEIRELPMPPEASPELQKIINKGINPRWNVHPSTPTEWHDLDKSLARLRKAPVQEIINKLNVTIEPDKINNVPVYRVKPAETSAENAGRLILNFHPGGYTLGSGESGLLEAILMAGLGKINVIAPDYRLAPDNPYPGALDDAMAVYSELLKTIPNNKIGVMGSSAGGALALALGLRAKDEGVPLPGAILAGSPWADITKTGDSYYTNEGVDQNLISHDGLLKSMAEAYLGDNDPLNPYISPVYGDYKNFVPVMLTAGGRDLFASNATRVQQKLRAADVPVDLFILDGLSHVQYLNDPDIPETRFYFNEANKFFNKYLAK